jgi:hypothetical protein
MSSKLGWLALLFLAILGLPACGTFGGQSLPFQTIAQGEQLRSAAFEPQEYGKPEILVIAEPKDIDALIQFMRMPDNPPGGAADPQVRLINQIRQVNYDANLLIVVLHGVQGMGGFRIDIQKIVRKEDEVHVDAKSIRPRGGPAVITDPYSIESLAKNDLRGKTIRFILRVNGNMVAETTYIGS